MSWTEQAEALTEAMGEIVTACTEVLAACWRARIDPQATTGLIAAALALGGDGPSLMDAGRGPVMGNDTALVATAADLEGAVAEMLKAAHDLATGCEEALAAAHAAASAAAAAIAAAQAAQASAKTQEAAAAAASDLAAAQAAMAAATAQIADCEVALEILGETISRLTSALAHLQCLPADLMDVYEACYALVRRGGELPHDGDFLTGGSPTIGQAADAA